MSSLGVVGAEIAPSLGRHDGLNRTYSGPLGSSRLSLWGAQPGAAETETGVLLFGRLFRPAKLASELQVDLEPYGDLDSRLVLRAYRNWGIGFPKHIDGEYAFALWDVSGGRLLLGRDTSGCWPLFYARLGEGFLFADEIRHLLALPPVAARLNEQRIAEWLAVHPVPTNQTFFEGILTTRPGSSLIFENGRTTENIWWTPEQTPALHLRDSREYTDGLIEVLERAVQDRLDKPSATGSLLSGGLDSSTVTATAANLLAQSGRRLVAFTAVPEQTIFAPGRFTDEGPHAAAVAAMYPNVDHVLVRHGSHSVFAMMDRFGGVQGEPIRNPGNYDWVYEILLQARRRGLSTVLVGNSGNLTISYAGDRALHSLLGQRKFIAAARLARDLHQQGNSHWRGIAHELLRPCMPLWARRAVDRTRRISSATREYSLIRTEFAKHHQLGPMAMEQASIQLDSRSLRLMYLRLAAMGASAASFLKLTGVEMIDPTGDRRVVEYCLSVPDEYYCEHGNQRSLIRNAMVGRLPEMVRTERRKGLQSADFGIQFERQRSEAWAELARMKNVDVVARALDLSALETMLHWSEAGVADQGGMVRYWPKLLRAFAMGRFLRRFEDGTLFPTPDSHAAPPASG